VSASESVVWRAAMISPRIIYTPRNDTSAKVEAAALAACYRIILDSQRKRDRHLDKDGPNDGTTTKEDSANVSSLPD
jgi:hypothetical protein